MTTEKEEWEKVEIEVPESKFKDEDVATVEKKVIPQGTQKTKKSSRKVCLTSADRLVDFIAESRSRSK